MCSSRSWPLVLPLFGLVPICTIPVRADQVSGFINVDNVNSQGGLGQTQKFSAGTVIGASQTHQGLDGFGGQHQAAAKALASLGGFDLLASTLLALGTRA